MLPFMLLDYVIKPLSLALRLFGNVFAAFVFMEFLSISLPVIVPGIVGLWFDIIDGVIQAVVFAYLTMSYIGENLETYNEYIEHPEEHQKKKKSKKRRMPLESKETDMDTDTIENSDAENVDHSMDESTLESEETSEVVQNDDIADLTE
jgi:hypothetical protein